MGKSADVNIDKGKSNFGEKEKVTTTKTDA